MESTLDTIEGTIPGNLWFHYDVGNDVLYIRLESKRRASAVGEETDDGVVLLRDEKSRKVMGITVVSWWKRFGKGALPDSFSEIQKKIKPWGKRIAA
jgi:uncharacterized protein YuzE